MANKKPQPTQQQITNRREIALQDAIARRLGFETWRKIGRLMIKFSLDNPNATNREINKDLETILAGMLALLQNRQTNNRPAEDIQAIMEMYPRQKRGRKAAHK